MLTICSLSETDGNYEHEGYTILNIPCLIDNWEQERSPALRMPYPPSPFPWPLAAESALLAVTLPWLANNLSIIMRCNLVRHICLLARRAAMMLPEQIVLQIFVHRFLSTTATLN